MVYFCLTLPFVRGIVMTLHRWKKLNRIKLLLGLYLLAGRPMEMEAVHGRFEVLFELEPEVTE
jgi:hypothetical protein